MFVYVYLVQDPTWNQNAPSPWARPVFIYTCQSCCQDADYSCSHPRDSAAVWPHIEISVHPQEENMDSKSNSELLPQENTAATCVRLDMPSLNQGVLIPMG